jgi:ubiquinone/menaquinone biosynthesis C-methylase UbiE
MLNRVTENHFDDTFSNIESARKYSEQTEKSSKMRYRGFLKILDELNIKGKYLDVGAGSGILATMIAERSKDIHIIAMELSPIMITIGNEIVKNKSLQSQIKFVNGNIEDSNSLRKQEKFDLVYSTFSLHHWGNPVKAISNLMQYVKDGGVLMIFDLKRVWWLYWIPIQTGFFKSIRASYKSQELMKIVNSIGIKRYEINNISPGFIQNITIWK